MLSNRLKPSTSLATPAGVEKDIRDGLHVTKHSPGPLLGIGVHAVALIQDDCRNIPPSCSRV